VPLVATTSGVKFGKTEAGTVWLDPARTSPFRFYQFWLNTADDDVTQYLKFFTLLGREEIAELEQAVAAEPHKRAAQQRLAEEVTRNVHGEAALARAVQASQVLFGGDIAGLSAADLMDIFAEVPSTTVAGEQLGGDGLLLVDLAAECGLERSRQQVRNLIENGGMYLNNVRVDDTHATVRLGHAIDGQVIVLRKGKKAYHLVQVAR
jgi:tyrosyl-tRNA synthetase